MLKPGMIVTDIDPESVLEGEQGEVMSVQTCLWSNPEVLVRFDRDLKDRFSFSHFRERDISNGIFELYEEYELRPDNDWTLERYAKRHFGDRWLFAEMCNRPLDPSKLCMVDECSGHETEVVWINLCGTVRNIYVCTEHAKKYKRYCYVESFPWRRQGEKQALSV